jgi:hypothetical protein
MRNRHASEANEGIERRNGHGKEAEEPESLRDQAKRGRAWRLNLHREEAHREAASFNLIVSEGP